jgi:hypothetical protein
MATLKVDLQEGFSGEKAVLRINGKEVYSGTPRTRMQIGLAESRSFDLPPKRVKLQFHLPESGTSKDIVLDLAQDRYVGISLSTTGEVSIHNSAEPFGYL